MIAYLSILYITRYFFHRWNKIIRRINGLDLLHWSTKMQAPHFVQVNKRQTQTPIGFKICLKLHSDLYDPFFFEIFYNISIQKRLNENSNKIWREINNMMDYKFKKFWTHCETANTNSQALHSRGLAKSLLLLLIYLRV